MTPAPIRIVAPGETTLLEIQEQAERHGLVLITDGRDMAYTRPPHIPSGWRRFVMADKSAPQPGEVHV